MTENSDTFQPIICLNCKAEADYSHRDKKFCSLKCSQEYKAKKKKGKLPPGEDKQVKRQTPPPPSKNMSLEAYVNWLIEVTGNTNGDAE